MDASQGATRGGTQGIQHAREGVKTRFFRHMLGGHVLQVVGLIQYQVTMGRQHQLARAQVGDEQGVIDHHQVGLGGRPARRLYVTLLPAWAVGTPAVIAVRPHQRPQLLPPGGQVELGFVTGTGCPQPGHHPGLPARLLPIQEDAPGAAQLLPLVQAEVVGPSLDHGHPEGQFQALADQGDVLFHQLLLQVDGVRRDHHRRLVGHCPAHRGQ